MCSHQMVKVSWEAQTLYYMLSKKLFGNSTTVDVKWGVEMSWNFNGV